MPSRLEVTEYLSDKLFVGLDITAFQNNGQNKPVSRVTLWVDDNNCLTAGDDTGMELEADCPFATQTMVDSILAQVQGYQYQAYTASDADIDPAAELGDGVTVNGVYSVLARIDDDGSGYPSISAPGEQELEEEYPTTGPMTQEFNRQIAETRSEISKTSEEIRLEVTQTVGDLSASFTVQLDNITSRVDGLDGDYAELKLTVDGVTITGPDGTTLINGGKIDADELHVNAANIDGTLSANQINMTGSITWSDLDTNVRSNITSATNTASQAQSDAEDALDAVSGWTYSGTTFIDGTQIMTGTVSASSLRGGEIRLITDFNYTIGYMTLTDASSTGNGAVEIRSIGGLRLLSTSGDVWMQRNDGVGPYVHLKTNAITLGNANVHPTSDGYYSSGTSSNRWSTVYAATGVSTTSDRRKKTNINYDIAIYDALFDALKPASCKYVDGTSNRTHLVLISQDVEEALEQVGLSSQDFGGFVKAPRTDEDGNAIEGEYDYFLRYDEFIAPCIHRIQEDGKQIKALEERVATLEARIIG